MVKKTRQINLKAVFCLKADWFHFQAKKILIYLFYLTYSIAKNPPPDNKTVEKEIYILRELWKDEMEKGTEAEREILEHDIKKFISIKDGEWRILHKLNVENPKHIARLSEYCFFLGIVYNHISSFLEDEMIEVNIRNLDGIGLLTTSKVYEFIGYWKAKMQQKKAKTLGLNQSVKERKQEVETDLWLNNVNKEKLKSFILKGLQQTDLGDKSIRNYFKEIINEGSTSSF